MELVNDSLSKEEYVILSCNKKYWQKDKPQYDKFIEVLKKYISLFSTDNMVYLEAISFPEIIFNEKLLGNNGIHMLNCEFYGKVTFQNLVFQNPVNINHSEFFDEVVYEKITFNYEVLMYWNNYHKEVIFEELIFKNEFDIDDIFNDNVMFKFLTFFKEADFGSLILKKKCDILNISGAENLKWDELLCIYDSLDVYWDEREKYIDSIFQKQDINSVEILKLVKEIKKLFPDVTLNIKSYLDDTSSGWSCYSWLEQFGNKTKELFQRRNYKEAQKHLLFIEKEYLKGSKNLQHIIEVAYIENILWKVPPDIRNEAMKYVPYTLNIGYI